MRLPVDQLWLCTQATDMRKSYDGLSAVVSGAMGRDPAAGDGYVFINKRRTQMKCLYFGGGGYCIWSTRLERGLFKHTLGGAPVELSETEFSALLEGFDVLIHRRRKRFVR